MRLSVVLPLYNEEKDIASNVENVIDTLRGFKGGYEIIIVNDGSTDNSLKVLKKISRKYSFVKIISYNKNRGRGYALRQGFDKASGDFVVVTESDLNWGSEIILNILFVLENKDADIVVASPYRKGGKLVNVPFKRAFLSRFGNILLSAAVNYKITMVSGMTRGYKREVIKNIVLENDDKEIHLEIISKAIALGYKIKEIPAVLKWEKKKKDKRNKAKKKSTFNAGKFIRTHLLFSFTESPILIFYFSIVISLFLAILLLLIFTLFGLQINMLSISIILLLLLIINYFMQFYQIKILGVHAKSTYKKLVGLYKPYLKLKRKIKK